jgi:pre-rRNA-processing protein IPI1
MRFLIIFLDFIPLPLVQGWNSSGSSIGKRILEGYLGNLSAGIKYGDGEGEHISELLGAYSSFGTAPSAATASSGVILSPAVSQ